jgi:hypothetical protein
MNTSAFKPEYVEKLKATQQLCKKQLESKGLHIEECSDEMGLSISLTQFGLSTIYATLTQEELEYIVDNEIEL